MKRAIVLIGLLALASTFIGLPAHADTAADEIMLFLFGLDTKEKTPLLNRLSTTENRWGVVALANPMDLAGGPIHGEVEIMASGSGDKGDPCKYKIRMYNGKAAVTSVYDFDFSQARDFGVASGTIMKVTARVVQLSGGAMLGGTPLFKVSSINMESGEVTHGSGSSWQYPLTPNAKQEPLEKAYADFRAQYCKG